MPTCWFCGVIVSTTQVCPRCKQEFGECHIDPANHDCPGVPVNNPYNATQIQAAESKNDGSPSGSGYSCAFCGTRIEYSSQCNECKKQFCIDHARPEDHNCPAMPNPIPATLKVHPRLQASLADTSCFDQKTLIPTPAPPRQSQLRATQQKASQIPPKITPPLPALPKPPPLPKININAAQTDIAVGCIFEACKECRNDPELHTSIDPVLSEFILSDPSVLGMFKKFAQNPSLREIFEKNPLTRGLYIWFDAVGEDLDALSAIGDEIKIPIAQLSLHELLQYYYAHLMDIASLLEARDTGGTPRVNYLEQSMQKEIGEEAKGSITISQSVIDEIAKKTRESGDREIIGYLVGIRDGKGNISLISRFVPLLLGDENECFSAPHELYEVLSPLDNTSENVIGIFHSHPGDSLPALSEQDIITHIRMTYRLSILECVKQLDVKLPFDERINMAFHLSTFAYAQIRYLLDVNFATFVFPSVINAIIDIICNENNSWDDIKRNIDTLIQKIGITPTPVDFPLLPIVDLIISPDYRFIGAGGLSFDPDLDHPGEMKTTPFFYHINVKSEIDKKQ